MTKSVSRMCVLTLALVVTRLLAATPEFLTPAISPAELDTKQKAGEVLLIIDVREPHEFAYVRVSGAMNIPVAELESHLEAVEQAQMTVLYCMDGRRTRLAEKTLLDHGIANVFHLEGSLPAWVQGGFPIEKGRPGRQTIQ